MAKWGRQGKRRLTAVFIGVVFVLLVSSCGGRQNQPTNDTGVAVTAQPAATAVGETELRIETDENEPRNRRAEVLMISPLLQKLAQN